MANASHLLTCGTFAFDPKCGVIVSDGGQTEREGEPAAVGVTWGWWVGGCEGFFVSDHVGHG